MIIEAIISRLRTVSYTAQEMADILEEKGGVKSHSLEKVTEEEIIEKVTASDANALRLKILENCEKIHPIPIVIYTIPYIEAFLVGSSSRNDIFEIAIIDTGKRNDSNISDDRIEAADSWKNLFTNLVANLDKNSELYKFLDKLFLRSQDFASPKGIR